MIVDERYGPDERFTDALGNVDVRAVADRLGRARASLVRRLRLARSRT